MYPEQLFLTVLQSLLSGFKIFKYGELMDEKVNFQQEAVFGVFLLAQFYVNQNGEIHRVRWTE